MPFVIVLVCFCFCGCTLISGTSAETSTPGGALTLREALGGDSLVPLPPTSQTTAPIATSKSEKSAASVAAETPKKAPEAAEKSEAQGKDAPNHELTDEELEEEVEGFTPNELFFSSGGDPIMRPGFVLTIMVMVGDKQELVPTQCDINDKCEILLPMVGKIACNGLTINGLQSKLITAFSEYYNDPEVTVQFANVERAISPWGRVMVSGCVRAEGWVSIPNSRDMTVSRAIQACGGFGGSAKRSSVRIIRRLPDGTKKIHRVNLNDIARKGELENDMLLENNDVIYVDESNF